MAMKIMNDSGNESGVRDFLSMNMPVEKLTVEWDKNISSYKKIARITIPKQVGVASLEQKRFERVISQESDLIIVMFQE